MTDTSSRQQAQRISAARFCVCLMVATTLATSGGVLALTPPATPEAPGSTAAAHLGARPAAVAEAREPAAFPLALGDGTPRALTAAVLDRGFAIAALVDDRGARAVRVAVLDETGATTAVVTLDEVAANGPLAVSIASAGEAVGIAWLGDRDGAIVPRLAIVDARGSALVDAHDVFDEDAHDGVPAGGVRIAWNASTREWALTWLGLSAASGVTSPRVARVGAWGGVLGPVTEIDEPALEAPALAPAARGFALAWTDATGTTRTVTLDAHGAPAGESRSMAGGAALDADAPDAALLGDDALLIRIEPTTDDQRELVLRSLLAGDASFVVTRAAWIGRATMAEANGRARAAWLTGTDAGDITLLSSAWTIGALAPPSAALLARTANEVDALALASGAGADLVAWIESDASDAGGERSAFAMMLPASSSASDEPGVLADGASSETIGGGMAGGSSSILACGGNRYVAPTGSDDLNDCMNQATPCLTISHAVAESCAGEIVFVAEGDYNEDVVIDKAITVDAQGSGVNTTLQGTGAGDVVTILSSNAVWDGVEITGATSHACLRVGSETAVELRGITVRNAAFFGCAIGLLFENTGSNLTGAWNRVLAIDARDNVTSGTDTSGVGILLRGGNGKLEIKSSFVRNNQGIGMLVEAPTGGRTNDTLVITGNRFINNGFSASAPRRAGMEIYDATATRIEGNRVREHDGAGPGDDDGRGFVLSNVVGGNFDCNNFEENDTGLELTNGTTGFPLLHNRFVTHAYAGLRTAAGTAAGMRVNEAVFSGNTLAIDHSGDGTLDARHSWWGTADGSPASGGSGDPVQGAVDAGGFIPRAVAPILVRRPVDTGWAVGQAACRDTIQGAVNAAVNGDLLVVGAGTYREKVTVAGKQIDIEGITDGSLCSPAVINAEQSGGSHLPALRITDVSGITVSNLTIRSAGEGTICGQNTGDEIGLDLQNVSSSTFQDLCLRENGVTEIRVYGNSDGNLFERIDIDGMLRGIDDVDECGHRSREGILIDGGPTCEGGPGAVASGNEIRDVTINYVARGVSLRFADQTEITESTLTASAAPAWDGGALSVGALVALSDDVLVQGNVIGTSNEIEGVRVAGRDAASCITERTNTLRTRIVGNSIVDATGAGVKLHRSAGDPGGPRATEVSCNEILRNGFGVRSDDAGSALEPNVVRSNDIRTNAVGVRNDALTAIDARENWWNSASGPGGGGGGTGDTVVGSVTFAPFLTSSAFSDSDGDTFSECAGDCDDTRATVYANAPELCDALDNDCDGSIDENLPLLTYYRDADGDGRGNASETIEVCNLTPPPGYVANADDCDDGDPLTYPGAPEILCDGIDQACNGSADETADVDADGYDVCDISDPADGDGLAADCADTDYDRNPGVAEIACDGIDNDCDGTVDVPGLTCGDLVVSGLTFAPGSKEALAWDASPAADAYALYRGTIEPAGFREYDHACAGAELPTPAAEDRDVPPVGWAYYYLATGTQIDGATGAFDNGPLGLDSTGASRPESLSVECGARVFVDPDAIAGAQNGLSWADAYTTVSGALAHSRGRARALTVLLRGTLVDETSFLTGNAFRGLRVLGGFAGTETSEWERDPVANPTSWREANGARVVDARRRSVVVDGVTFEQGSTGVYAELDRGDRVELRRVRGQTLTEQLADIVVVGPGGGRLVAEGLDVDGSGARGIRAIARSGTLTGHVRESVFAGSTDTALRLEASGQSGDATVALRMERLTIAGGRVGVILGAHASDAGFSAQQVSTLASSLVHGTSEEGVRLEATGSFASFAGPLAARNVAILTGNTISDAGAAGVVVSATRTDSTPDPSLHAVEAVPALWGNLVTFNTGASVEESGDDTLASLVADPVLVANGLFGSSSLVLDEGTSPITDVAQVNALGANSGNFDLDPLFVDRLLADFRLQTGSPAIDAGRTDAPALATEDRDGARRRRGSSPDAGAYEAIP